MHLLIEMALLDTKPSAAILSLGAVVFSNNEIYNNRYWELTLEDQFLRGRTVSETIIRWWGDFDGKSKKVLSAGSNHIEGGRTELRLAVDEFIRWVDGELVKRESSWDALNVWSKGPDITIISDVLYDYRLEVPWRSDNELCFKTFNRLTKATEMYLREGESKNALAEAIYLTNCVIAYYKAKRAKRK